MCTGIGQKILNETYDFLVREDFKRAVLKGIVMELVLIIVAGFVFLHLSSGLAALLC